MSDGSAPVHSPRFTEALATAARWHIGQARKGGDVPYISHLLSVSALVWEDGGTEDEAIAGLLHDSVEDLDDVTVERVEELFGPRVAEIVEACTDAEIVPKPPWKARKDEHLAHLDACDDAGIMRVVAADKLANARTVVLDARHVGDALWGRFKGGQGGTTWYYSRMSRAVSRVLPDSRNAEELGRLAGTLDTLMDARRSVLDGLDVRIERALRADDPFGLGDVADDTYPWLAFELARRHSSAGSSLDVAGLAAYAVEHWTPEGLATEGSEERLVAVLRSAIG